MLVLSRRQGQRITIADSVTLTVLKCKGGTVRLGFDAPHDVRILREEVESQCQDRSSFLAGEGRGATIA